MGTAGSPPEPGWSRLGLRSPGLPTPGVAGKDSWGPSAACSQSFGRAATWRDPRSAAERLPGQAPEQSHSNAEAGGGREVGVGAGVTGDHLGSQPAGLARSASQLGQAQVAEQASGDAPLPGSE